MLNNKRILIPTLLIAVLANVSVIFLSEYQRFRDNQEQAIKDRQRAEALVRVLKAEAKKREVQEQNRRELAEVLRKHSEQIVESSNRQLQESTKLLEKGFQGDIKLVEEDPTRILTDKDKERY